MPILLQQRNNGAIGVIGVTNSWKQVEQKNLWDLRICFLHLNEVSAVEMHVFVYHCLIQVPFLPTWKTVLLLFCPLEIMSGFTTIVYFPDA